MLTSEMDVWDVTGEEDSFFQPADGQWERVLSWLGRCESAEVFTETYYDTRSRFLSGIGAKLYDRNGTLFMECARTRDGKTRLVQIPSRNKDDIWLLLSAFYKGGVAKHVEQKREHWMQISKGVMGHGYCAGDTDPWEEVTCIHVRRFHFHNNRFIDAVRLQRKDWVLILGCRTKPDCPEPLLPSMNRVQCGETRDDPNRSRTEIPMCMQILSEQVIKRQSHFTPRSRKKSDGWMKAQLRVKGVPEK